MKQLHLLRNTEYKEQEDPYTDAMFEYVNLNELFVFLKNEEKLIEFICQQLDNDETTVVTKIPADMENYVLEIEELNLCVKTELEYVIKCRIMDMCGYECSTCEHNDFSECTNISKAMAFIERCKKEHGINP